MTQLLRAGNYVVGHAGKVVGVISTAAAIASMVILRPHLSASLDERLNASLPLSQPIRITNDGLLPVQDFRIFCYIGQIRSQTGEILQLSGFRFFNSLARPGAQLESGESKTFVCTPDSFYEFDYEGSATNYAEAEFAGVVTYSPYLLPFWNRIFIARFVGVKLPNGDMRFVPQPSGEIRQQVLDFFEQQKKMKPFPGINRWTDYYQPYYRIPIIP